MLLICIYHVNFNYMESYDIIKMTREAQGKKQKDIAGIAGIRQQSLQRYETGLASLSIKTLSRIEEELQINPKYINDSGVNPYKSNDLIKFHFSEKLLDKLFMPTYILFEVNQKLEFISLVCDVDLITKIKQKIPFKSPVYAVAIRDQDDNIFLLRRKSRSDIVTLDHKLSNQFSLILQYLKFKGEKKLLSFGVQKIDDDLYEKIRLWTIERVDIEPLFSQCKFDFYIDPTQKELLQLTEQRNQRMDVLNVLELRLVKELREKRISTDEVLKWIMGRN